MECHRATGNVCIIMKVRVASVCGRMVKSPGAVS
ncbi:hypothetical protein [Fodinibius roseus]